MRVNSPRAMLPEDVSAGKRIHGPGDANAHGQEQEKRPQDVLDAVLRASASQETESNRNDQGEQQEGLEMRQRKTTRGNHALRPRAAS